MKEEYSSERPFKVKLKKNVKGSFTYEITVEGNSIDFVEDCLVDLKKRIDIRIKDWKEEPDAK